MTAATAMLTGCSGVGGGVDPQRTAIILGAIVIGGGGLWFWWRRRRSRGADRAYERVRDSIKKGAAEEALDAIRLGRRAESGSGRKRWTVLEITARRQLDQVAHLCELYTLSPEAFREHEAASIMVGRLFLEMGQYDDLAGLRDMWQGRGHMRGSWLGLEADYLVRQGKSGEARTLLEGRKFKGAQESARLARLAMLLPAERAREAQEMFAAAGRLDPNNADLMLCEARFLERNQQFDAALGRYRAAVQRAPHDPVCRDRTAEFLRRHGDNAGAVNTWAQGLAAPSADFIWLKALFWSRAAVAASVDFTSYAPPPTALEPLIEFLVHLAPERYWDEAAFEPVVNHQPELLSRQEVYWLRIIESLRRGDEDGALSLLNLMRFGRASWHEDLEWALTQILTYRRVEFVNPSLVAERPPKRRHPFFAQLDAWVRQGGRTTPPALKVLLQGPGAFATAFQAAGWTATAQALSGKAAE